jgi:type II secretory pathway pseudopilin PulG
MYKLIYLYSDMQIMGLLGAAVVGGMVGRRSARRQMESMQKQAQQAQQVQAQAQQVQAQAQAQQAQASTKTDPMQEIAKLDLKAKGLLTEEEFHFLFIHSTYLFSPYLFINTLQHYSPLGIQVYLIIFTNNYHTQ